MRLLKKVLRNLTNRIAIRQLNGYALRRSVEILYRRRVKCCPGAEHPMLIQYLPLNEFCAEDLSKIFRKIPGYANIDRDQLTADEDFCRSAGKALDVLKEFCPRQYNWAVGHVSAIVNVPTFDGNHFYSYRQNQIYLDFFSSGFTREENTLRWNTVWLAGILSILCVHARVCRYCPSALIFAPERVERLAKRQARRVTSRASDEVYDFTGTLESGSGKNYVP